MIDKLDEKLCTGCLSCMQKCPTHCIRVGKDSDGFNHPEIDSTKCIKCDMCEKVCPILSGQLLHEPISAYAARTKDKDLLRRSTSGGIFGVVARKVLRSKGIVFGVRLDENGIARTIAIESEKQLASIQGSKYVQSYTGKCYQDAEAHLKEGRIVLFSGTPCQIEGLKKYLGKDYVNLYTVDVICHGVPSQELFSAMWKWMGEQKKSVLQEWRFRAKEAEGWAQVDHLIYESGEMYKREYRNPYTYAFLKSTILRESCYNCPFAKGKRAGDITLGDYWGIKHFHPEFYSTEGVSLMLINTKQGEKLYHSVEDEIDTIPSKLSYMQKYNGGLVEKPKKPSNREGIYQAFHNMPFDIFLRKRLKVPFEFKEVLKEMIPYKARQQVKKVLGR